MKERTVDVKVGTGYQAVIGPGLLQSCGGRIARASGPCRAVIVTDSRVAELYLEKVRQSMSDAGFSVESFVFPRGEGSKNMAVLWQALEFMAESRLTR
ncbi:MAG TPA: 3-dehydroquinate synthase, partial [Clostridiales bacterium]|nr:3-dehydroquinate synthase [Clostridiales bacterium]